MKDAIINVKPPPWLIEEIRKTKKSKDNVKMTSQLLTSLRLNTVCDNALCPNRRECFSHHTATFLILGDVCTRDCTFCAVKHGLPQAPPDPNEPNRLAQAASELGLTHVVVTSVTRDDLPDGGAAHFAEVVHALQEGKEKKGIVELLVPDFKGLEHALATVLAARPDILGHNIETVPSLYRQIRHGADYNRSLTLLRQAKRLSPGIITKSGIMLGLGETEDEIKSVIVDLSATGCDMLTIGQYLAPSLSHASVKRYVSPDEFTFWQKKAISFGFKSVAAGPLVRSSYNAPLFFGAMMT